MHREMINTHNDLPIFGRHRSDVNAAQIQNVRDEGALDQVIFMKTYEREGDREIVSEREGEQSAFSV